MYLRDAVIVFGRRCLDVGHRAGVHDVRTWLTGDCTQQPVLESTLARLNAIYAHIVAAAGAFPPLGETHGQRIYHSKFPSFQRI